MKLEEILPEIRNGRRFKRAIWDNYYTIEEQRDASLCTLLGFDFELEPNENVKKVISREDLEKAWIETYGVAGSHFREVCERLGL